MIKKRAASSHKNVKVDKVFIKSMEDLTEVIIEDLEADYQNDLEPSEAYMNHIRYQVHANLGRFRYRFLRGYEVLLEELKEIEEGGEK